MTEAGTECMSVTRYRLTLIEVFMLNSVPLLAACG